jgi:hypothetical protein
MEMGVSRVYPIYNEIYSTFSILAASLSNK